MPLQVWTRLEAAPSARAKRGTSSGPVVRPAPEPFQNAAWAWWAEGLGRTRRPQLEGVSLPKERLLQLQALGFAPGSASAALAPEPARKAVALCRPGACSPGLPQAHGPTRSTSRLSAWKRRLRRHRARNALRAAGPAGAAAERWGHPCCCCAMGLLSTGSWPGVWAWPISSGLSLRRTPSTAWVVGKGWWASGLGCDQILSSPLLRASGNRGSLPRGALWPPP